MSGEVAENRMEHRIPTVSAIAFKTSGGGKIFARYSHDARVCAAESASSGTQVAGKEGAKSRNWRNYSRSGKILRLQENLVVGPAGLEPATRRL
jgi:hypothetical protein